mgnify:CR=1 FL=1
MLTRALDGVVLDIDKNLIVYSSAQLATENSFAIDKDSGTISIKSNGVVNMLILKDFTDSNVIFIPSNVLLPSSKITQNSKTESSLIISTIRIH